MNIVGTTDIANDPRPNPVGSDPDLGAYESPLSSPDLTPPAPPTKLTASVGSQVVNLDWDDNIESDFDYYSVYRSTSDDTLTALSIATDVLTSNYSDNTVSNTITYYYWVTATDTGYNESALYYANGVPATPGDFVPPAAPTGLAATGGEDVVHLSWEANSESDLDGYVVYRHTVRDSLAADSIYTAAAVDTSHDDNAVFNDTTYYYWLTAVDSTGNQSAFSAASSATPQDTTAPAVPTGLTATAGEMSVGLSWRKNAENDLRYYTLYRDTVDNLASAAWRADVNPPDTTFLDSSVVVDTTYYYWLGAVDLSGNASEMTASVNAQPFDNPPAAPQGLVVLDSTGGIISLEWQPNGEPDLMRYDLYGGTGPDPQAVLMSISDSAHVDINDLLNGVRYYFALTAVDSNGHFSQRSNEVSAVPHYPPVAATAGASDLRPNSAVLRAIVDPLGWTTDVAFNWGPTPGYGFTIPANPAQVGGTDPLMVSAVVSDLLPETTYHYQVTAQGPGGSVIGRDTSFTTLPEIVTPVVNQAIRFNGVSDYLAVPDHADLNVDVSTSLSITGWVKVDSGAGAWTLASKFVSGTGGYQLGSLTGTDVRFAFIDAGHPVNFVRATVNVADGQWHYLAGVRDAVNNELRLYIDGRPAARADDLTNASTGNSADFEIGRSGAGGYIRGTIDDVGLWRSALTTEEVRRNMYWRLNGTEFGLVAYWPLDEGFGGTAVDATGRGHDGSVQGSPAWVLSTVPAGQSIVDEEVVTGPGEVTFSGTGVAMNFTAISGTDTFMVAEMTGDPAGEQPQELAGLGDTYWVIDHFGTGTFDLELTLVFGPGAISQSDRDNPANIRLFRRDSRSDGPWEVIAAAILATDSSATFPNITSFSQFWSGTVTGVGSLPEPVAAIASDQTGSSATLHGTVNPNNFTTTVAFEYGLTNSYGNQTALENPLPAGVEPVAVSAPATNLLPDTTYRFRIRAENIAGAPVYSNEQTFRTLPVGSAPALVSDSPGEISDTTALLEAMVNPHKLPTSVRFRYGLTAAYGDSVSVPEPITSDTPHLVTALLENLIPDALYHYRVVASNERGSITGRDTTFTTTDTQAPVISDLTMDPASGLTEEQALTVSATIADRSGTVQEAALFYSTGGPVFIALDMAAGVENTYSAAITGVTRSGIVWYVDAEDAQGNETVTDTFYVQVKFAANTLTTASVTGSAYSNGIPKDKWRLFSIPADLDQTQLNGSIGDDLGEQTEYTWKVFKYVDPDYVVNPGTLNSGEGYWIYQRVEEGIALALGSGKTNDLESFSITLKPGWNLIGAPYPFLLPIDLDQREFYGPLTYGSTGGEGWSDVVDQLEPWGGYAVYSDTTVDRIITLTGIHEGTGLGKLAWEQPDGWLLHLQVRGRTYVDEANTIGRLARATETLDHFDKPEPPYIEGYVSLAMERPEWGRQLPRFTTDIRSLEEANGVWDLDLYVKGEQGPVELTSQLSGELPANTAVLLVDLMLRRQYDLLDTEVRVSLTDYSEQFPYHLKVVAGDPAWAMLAVEEIFAALPEDFALSQNYPNPFNPSTTIEYALPRPARVSLRIYDLLGREMVILEQGWQDMGYHQVIWNGRDRRGVSLASGVYFAVFQAERTIRTRKMLLLK